MRLCYDTLGLVDERVEVGVPAVVAVVKKGGGRPYAFTPRLQKRYLKRIRKGDGRDLAARNVGIAPNTVRAHRRLVPEFDEQILAAEREKIDLIENAAVQTALAGNATMQIFLLTNLKPEVFADRRSPRVLQQLNAAPSVEWTLAEARQEAFKALDELEAKRREKAAEAQDAIDAPSRGADDG